MKSCYKVSLAAVLLGGGIVAGSLMNNSVNGASSSGQPGTADDPVVTKSYVDQKIAQAIKGGVPASNTSSKTTSSNAPATNTTSNTTASGTSSAGKASTPEQTEALKVVDVKPGQKLIAKAGSEFILRNGYAVVYSMDASGAIDITSGTEIVHNQALEKNHLLSFPREGRGIQVKEGQKFGLVVMVRGGYTVQ
ncbi:MULTISPECIES: hypothetical protein [Paenibacillus]|uniref:hypothetical protein n=1 Tax=Paenibacillus TaxID=44249 RepID=UPI00048ECCFD|nr:MULTISPECIES: hypothetical protein [Paenibacillus]APB73975.1 hypothetical protein PPYC2_02610 [Paenibacillus polymyxa]OMF73521.1 hypothetical protein BK143_06500 [Paenibacillus peoriae]OMF76173.1 hypothetical protein BK145_22385 [Paenibacillus peoriae]POR26637.1 hypothetical protein CG775_16730 [Paenibacillus polymyxa]SFR26328.1 hypothetical protein SAMN04488603_11165 [Paenibacillus sp. cl130]